MTDQEALAGIEAIFGNLPTLETQRLLLRRITLADAPALFAVTSDPAVVRYVPLPLTPTLEEAQALTRQFVALAEAKCVTQWAVVEKASNELVGLCGFEQWGIMSDRAEIGFIFARSRWRKGYAHEACEATLTFGFQTMKLNRIEGRTRPENEAAMRLMETLGMAREGLLRGNLYFKGAYQDLFMYAMLREDPAARRYLTASTSGPIDTLAGRLFQQRAQEMV